MMDQYLFIDGFNSNCQEKHANNIIGQWSKNKPVQKGMTAIFYHKMYSLYRMNNISTDSGTIR
jgi:hypothetical protein